MADSDQHIEVILGGHGIETNRAVDPYAKKPRLLMIIWPSTGGNARSFRIKESELKDQGILLLRYNPTSHGRTIGTYDPQTSIHDLLHYLHEHQLDQLPVIGIGHSGGGAAFVMMEGKLNFVKRYLLSPILDSRLSLFYLYKNKNIHEFVSLLLSSNQGEKDKEITLERNGLTERSLSEEDWMHTGNISSLHFPIRNSRIHLEDLGQFLKNIFLPGFNISKQLLSVYSPVNIFLPTKDQWFPISETLKYNGSPQITINTIETATDHFFTSAWLAVWEKIKLEIFR
jgi:hypothetical protein